MRGLLRFVGALVMALAISVTGAFVVLYFVLADDYRVPETVATDSELPRIELEQITLHGESWGDADAPVVLVLHGGPGGDYRALMPLTGLADEYRVVFYDQRGAGLSPRVANDDLTLEAYWADLQGVMDAQAPDRKVVLIGHSWGAMLASSFVAQHPQRVAALVLAEPGFLTSEAANDLMTKTNRMMPPMSWQAIRTVITAGIEAMHVEAPDGDDDAWLDYLMHRIMFTQLEGHPIAGYFCDDSLANAALEDWRFGARVSTRLIESVTTESGAIDVDFRAPDYQRPVLFLTGSCNRLIGTAYQQEYHLPHVPAARLVEIEGAGHTMFGEKPEASLRAVRRFLHEVFEPEEAVEEDTEPQDGRTETESEGAPEPEDGPTETESETPVEP